MKNRREFIGSVAGIASAGLVSSLAVAGTDSDKKIEAAKWALGSQDEVQHRKVLEWWSTVRWNHLSENSGARGNFYRRNTFLSRKDGFYTYQLEQADGCGPFCPQGGKYPFVKNNTVLSVLDLKSLGYDFRRLFGIPDYVPFSRDASFVVRHEGDKSKKFRYTIESALSSETLRNYFNVFAGFYFDGSKISKYREIGDHR